MVHVCCVPGCSSQSNRKRDLSFFSLPLKDKTLLRSMSLDVLTYASTSRDVGTNTEWDPLAGLEAQATRIAKLEEELLQIKKCLFRLENMANNDRMVSFYTGFLSYTALYTCFKFLGPAVDYLQYNEGKTSGSSSEKRFRPHVLAPLEEFFLVLTRLRLGLMEQDLAYHFGVSQSTVSRVTISWINFMFLHFKQVSLWPSKEMVQSYMPKVFCEQYPSTRVIIDATEVFVEQPRLPELQQMIFSSYKNDNTYKALIGISPSGAITFVSKLFPGSISNKQLTYEFGILDLLETGDSLMADKGFDIEQYLIPLGVKLNIPPFLRGKTQFDHSELVKTRHVASLRIHVVRAMERMNIFDCTLPVTLTGIANRMFFVCCFLSNFHPPLYNDI